VAIISSSLAPAVVAAIGSIAPNIVKAFVITILACSRSTGTIIVAGQIAVKISVAVTAIKSSSRAVTGLAQEPRIVPVRAAVAIRVIGRAKGRARVVATKAKVPVKPAATKAIDPAKEKAAAGAITA
jgi:hypothetical protein